MKLTFGKANAKLVKLEKALGGKVFTFSLLSGFTCPYAKECDSRAIEDSNGKRTILDGPRTLFRCFSASQEALFTNVYNSRKANQAILEVAAKPMGDVQAGLILLDNMPKKAKIVRLHVAGDFKTQAYFDAWCFVARSRPDILFYAYTKSLPFWIKRKDVIPANLVLTASYGGYKDGLIAKHNLRYTKVVFSVAEAAKLGLEIDSDDSHAADPAKRNDSFALLIHGAQPKGSEAGKAVRLLDGVGSYGKGK